MNCWRNFLETRFVLCVGAGAVCSILLWFGKLDSGSYTAIIMGTVGAYVAGGAIERVKELGAAKATQP